MKEIVIKKCLKCNALVSVLKDCTCDDCGIKCCGEAMNTLIPNTEDASVEKHKPILELIEDKIHITVNHVMEEVHYIEWVKVITSNKEETYYFNPGDTIDITCEYDLNIKVYAYCNLHNLWESSLN